jgi:hypothetical protein
MKPSITPPDLEPTDLDKVPDASSILLQSEIEDLERELRVVRKKERWHFAWALFGTSPAALIPAIGLSWEGSYGLVVLLSLMVTISQLLLGVRATGKATRLEKALESLRREESPDPR